MTLYRWHRILGAQASGCRKKAAGGVRPKGVHHRRHRCSGWSANEPECLPPFFTQPGRENCPSDRLQEFAHRGTQGRPGPPPTNQWPPSSKPAL